MLEETVNGTLAKSYTLGDDVLAQTVGATTSYLQYDGHGSTRLLTSATSAIANRFDYDAYGKNLFSANVTSPASTDMLYSGEQFDPNLQMQYLRARYYDQNNGRFNRVDPFAGNNSDPQSLHKYAYCHGNPVMGIDPSGNMSMVQLMTGMTLGMSLLTLGMYYMGDFDSLNPNEKCYSKWLQLSTGGTVTATIPDIATISVTIGRRISFELGGRNKWKRHKTLTIGVPFKTLSSLYDDPKLALQVLASIASLGLIGVPELSSISTSVSPNSARGYTGSGQYK